MTLQIHHPQRSEALEHWGNPTSTAALTQLFLDHLHSKRPSTPFSPTPLSAESLAILPHLERLTQRGWWTVGSQPGVDGASSTDVVYGWGPREGYVFQKCFVEFFCETGDLERLEERIEGEGSGWVHYFACNYAVGVCFPSGWWW